MAGRFSTTTTGAWTSISTDHFIGRAEAEEEIEGLLRLLTLQTLGSWRDYRVRVLDVGSTDGTGQIVQTLMQHSGNLDYVYLHGNEDLIQNITLSCLDTARVSCVYDLRNQDLHSGMSRDIAGLCRGS
jgi:glycosyltransferase involved in cell wall biosynthesis